jgi:exocyst complex protein 7
VNGQLEHYSMIYVNVQCGTARASLETLELGYLQEEFNNVTGKDEYIDKWTRHMEFVVKHLLDVEYKIYSEVYEKIGPNVYLG